MTTISMPSSAMQWHWLRSARFDLTLIVGVAVVAAGTGFLVSAVPALFVPILIFDLWILGYHHVVSTYTRLCFDRQSLAEHRFLVFGLLPIIGVLTFALAWSVGLWAIITLYFYWQWFHYTRQSWGLSRAYRAKDKDALFEDGFIDQAIFYALPVVGILYRSYQDPATFLGLPIEFLPTPAWVVTGASVVAAGLLAYWIVRRIHAWRSGRLAPTHTLYMVAHFGIFAVGYLLIENLTYGWLAINMWHNAQYILFVWLFNTRRFKNGVDPKARFLSYISQPQRLWLYLATCLAITGVLYAAILGSLSALFFSGLAATVILYQAVNFHHYVVDSVIWKLRKRPIREVLDIAG